MGSTSQLDERRSERGDRERSALLLTLAISVLAHVALLPPLIALIQLGGGEASKSDVQLVSVSRAKWQKNRSLKVDRESLPNPDRQERPEERTPEERDEPTPPGQVVALPPPERAERPDHADYASEHDRRVERESHSRHQTPQFLNPTHRPQIGDPTRRQVPSQSEPTTSPLVIAQPKRGGPEGEGKSSRGEGTQPEGEGGGRAAMELALPDVQQRDQLALRLDKERGELQNRSYSEQLAGQGRELKLRLGPPRPVASDSDSPRPGPEGRRGGTGDPGVGISALMPDLDTLEQLSGAPANDHLPDTEEDDATFLNTWRWKHAPFFNRVKDSIARQWNPGPSIARRDPTGNVYGIQDRYTLLQITITRDGEIDEISIAESCGVDFLDREALLASKRAEPFANPPSRLFGDNDRYTFYFGFNLGFQTSPFIQFNWRAAP